MIFRIDELKNICNIIASAVDTNKISLLNDLLELKVDNTDFLMCVTNTEYYVKVKLTPPEIDKDFHATVNANIFLRLISKMTTDIIQLKVEDNSLVIIGNGTYRLPIIFENEVMLELPQIDISNITVNFNIDGDLLNSVNKYNTKQLSIGYKNRDAQEFFYIDEFGAITYTSIGACVNKFTLSTPVKMLLNSKLVKMFTLFKDKEVSFSMGYDAVTNNVIQTKVKFEADNICITAILSANDALVSSFQASNVRNKAFNVYDNSVVINKNELIQSLDRLMLIPYKDSSKKYDILFSFNNDFLEISDLNGNFEKVYFNTPLNMDDKYNCGFFANEIKSVIECFNEQYITFNFGDNKAIVVSNGTIYNVLMECEI